MTVKGQVTIPKKVREALRLLPGDGVEFDVNHEGQVVVYKAGGRPAGKRNRFESARGKAQVREFFVNPVICAELSLAFDSVKAVDEAIQGQRVA